MRLSRVIRIAAVLLTGVLASRAHAQAPPVVPEDCKNWTRPNPERTDLEWRTRLDFGLRCLGSRLEKLASDSARKTDALGKEETLNSTLTTLGDIHTELVDIKKWLAEHPPKAGGTSYITKEADPKLRGLLNDQIDATNKLLEKVDRLRSDTSWIVLQPPAASKDAPEGGEKSDATGKQVDPGIDVRTLFPRAARIVYAVALIADPRVPRHRRFYDNQITAMSQGMLANGFVLDRYQFPWQDALKSSSGSGFALDDIAKDARFGLAIYRRDNWRYDTSVSTSDVRAIYLVPETATYGAQTGALAGALRKIAVQFGFCPVGPKPSIPVFGPTFSGSLDSIARTVRETNFDPEYCPSMQVRIQSPSATARTNRNFESVLGKLDTVRFLAMTDYKKLEALSQVVSTLEGNTELAQTTRPGDVAFLFETSVFGFDTCSGPEHPTICDKQKKISFPANIADIRFGLTKRAAERARAKNTFEIPQTGVPHLALEEGAENGSEFPESFQSPLTAVANQLDLDVAISTLKGNAPRVAVVAATDVRDRIFLFEQLRSQLKNTMLVDLETDRLLAHPDTINATRGAVTLASSEINMEQGAWSTDHQALLAALFCNWTKVAPRNDPQDTSHRSCDAIAPVIDAGTAYVHLHAVTRNGLVSAEQKWGADVSKMPSNGLAMIAPALVLLVYVVLCITLVWRATTADMDAPERCLDARMLLLIVLVPVLWNVQASAKVWVVIVIVIAVGTFSALRRMFVQISASMRKTELGRVALGKEIVWLVLPGIAAFLLLIMLVFEAVNFFTGIGIEALKNPHSMEGQLLLLRLALTGDPGGGLAYGLAVCAIGGGLLFAFSASVTYSAAARRNEFIHPPVPQKRQLKSASEEAADSQSAGHGAKLGERIMSQGRRIIAFREEDCRWFVAFLVGCAALWMVSHPVLTGDLKLTIFGRVAGYTAYVGLLAVTISGTLMFASAPWIVLRVKRLCAELEGPFRCHRAKVKDQGFTWDLGAGDAPLFAATPILARHEQVSEKVDTLLAQPNLWRQAFSEIFWARSLPKGARVPNECWLPAYALLASYMTIYRWAVIGVLVTTLTAATIVYLFPVSNADGLLLFNLALLFAVGAHSAYVTVDFETHAVLSRILCNREQKASLSTSLFAFIAFPFGALAIAVAIAQVPGVLSWGDGIFDLLMKVITPSSLK